MPAESEPVTAGSPELIPVLPQHRFDEAALARYLWSRLPGFDGAIQVRQFQGGQSNPTFHVGTPAGDYVLRKKPPGLLLPRAAHAEAAAATVPSERIEQYLPQLDELARDALRRAGVPGLSVAVVHGDRVVHLAAFGVRQAGKPESIDPDTVFELASMSKPMKRSAMRWSSKPRSRRRRTSSESMETTCEAVKHSSEVPAASRSSRAARATWSAV